MDSDPQFNRNRKFGDRVWHTNILRVAQPHALMGLAGRKQKQRIPADPRNLGWADGEPHNHHPDHAHVPPLALQTPLVLASLISQSLDGMHPRALGPLATG